MAIWRAHRVDPWPALVAGLLGEEVPQAAGQSCLRLAARFEVGEEEGLLRFVTSPVHQDDR